MVVAILGSVLVIKTMRRRLLQRLWLVLVLLAVKTKVLTVV